MNDAAQSVLEACAEAGIADYVVCAGARNAPLVLALVAAEEVRVWHHFEERSAGFFALGRSMDTGSPCAVVTTSGTAAAELLPAVIEAHYQGRPLVVITADRPAAYRGSGAPQAIEQVGLFGRYAEGCLDVDGATPAGFDGWSGAAPWHLNVCLGEETPVPVMPPVAAVPPPAPKRPGVVELKTFLTDRIYGGLVVLVGGLEPEEREETFHFLTGFGVPVLADATSGLREALGGLCLADGDRILRAQVPGKVLRLGDVPVGRFWRDLEDLPEVEVCSVTRTGFSGLARESHVVKGRVDHALRGLGPVPRLGDLVDHLEAARKRQARIDELLERFPDGEPALVRELSTYATLAESVFLGNSLPIREWNLFAQRDTPVVDVRASRGANGIDGQISTWLGSTVGQDGAWAVLGDLTTLYDLSAPALLAQAGGQGRVLAVLNNGGGRIFGRLPRLRGIGEQAAGVIANAHATGFADWARMWGMEHQRVTARDQFDFEPGNGTTVLELCPDAGQTAGFWEAYEGLGS